MADDADRAAEIQELYQQYRKKGEGQPYLPATGFCHNCHEQVGLGALWCNTDCEEDWAKRTRR